MKELALAALSPSLPASSAVLLAAAAADREGGGEGGVRVRGERKGRYG